MKVFAKAARALSESWFLELGPTLTLYHGSSSGKLERFMSEGVRVPRGSHWDHLYNTAVSLWNTWGPQASTTISPGSSLPREVLSNLERYYEKRTSASVPDENKGYIYTSYHKEVAVSYARKYAQGGSELTGKAYWFVGNYLRDTFDFEMPARFSGGTPIVLTLEVDWDWVIVPLETSGSFREFVAKVVSAGTGRGQSLSDIESERFYHKDWQSEVLVTQDIPPSRIVAVEDV